MIDPNAIRARVRQALELAGKVPWLVGYDINGIQELVTASNRPIAMRGASQAIKDFDAQCREATPMSVFAGGGRGVELAPSEAAARERIQSLISSFHEKTHGGVLAADAVPYRHDAQGASLSWLGRKLESAKDAARRPGGDLPLDKDSQCADCNAFRAKESVASGGEDRHVCSRCILWIKTARGTGEASQSLLAFARNRRIAAISADGNNFGAFFASLTSLEEMAAASEAVASFFREAHEAALRKIEPLQALSPVTGGDDIRVFVAPAGVLPYVEALVRGVEERASRAGELGGLLPKARAQALARIGVGVGAVVAGDHYPAARLMAYAHDMERSAKAICRTDTDKPDKTLPAAESRSAFDFTIISSGDGFVDEERPLPIPLDETTWARVLHNIQALRRVPTTQRAVLAERRSLPSSEEFDNIFCYQVARSPKWQDWCKDCKVDWTDRVALREHIRNTRVDLLDLLPPERSDA